jgi:cytochrome c peroxidase
MQRARVVLAIAALVGVACGGGASDEARTPTPTPNDPDDPGHAPPLPQPLAPAFGQTRHLADAPPPISGGTLTLLTDGRAAASDPDRDRVYLVDYAGDVANAVVKTIQLDPHDEPGRLVEDGAGKLHVVLRSGHGVATIDLAAATLLSRRPTCAAPRGIAVDGDRRVLVACEGGELVALSLDPSGQAQLVATLDRDLRDVVVTPTKIFVSRFRRAEVLELGLDGTLVARTSQSNASKQATLAWRMLAAPAGDASDMPIVVHQMSTDAMVEPQPGGYGSVASFAATSCNDKGPVVTVVSRGGSGVGPIVEAPTHAVVPVDVAVDGTDYVVVAAGNGHTSRLPQAFVFSANAGCGAMQRIYDQGQAVAVAVRGTRKYIVQSREPAQLKLWPEGNIIALASESREDTGHAIFHSNSGIGIACASCHGEGGDDGHVWTFDGLGRRRTPSLRGTLEGTAPYHWDGAMKSISQLADEVMTSRMHGPALLDDQKSALESWLFALPAPALPAPSDPAAVARGKALFESAGVGCAGCHSGPKLTNSATVDVGTGGAFQVPSLVGVSARTPLLHDGCATTLADRFGSCGGSKHGNTSSLAQSDIDDLVAYLSTL